MTPTSDRMPVLYVRKHRRRMGVRMWMRLPIFPVVLVGMVLVVMVTSAGFRGCDGRSQAIPAMAAPQDTRDFLHRIEHVIDLLSNDPSSERKRHTSSSSSSSSSDARDEPTHLHRRTFKSSFTHSNSSFSLPHLQEQQQQQPLQQKQSDALRILHSMRQELLSTSRQRKCRRLEEQQYDEDDYFNYYNVYHQRTSSDVEITFDEEDNTVVTVGDDVIVLVDHEYTFYLYNGAMIALCILIGATMAGLLMGVMSLDPLIVSVKARTAATPLERRQALTLLPFVQNKNLVLVSLLLVNCGTNEALPVFLDNMLENPLITVLLSLTVVLVVGEILPSAYFTGRDQVTSASKLVPVLRFVIVLTSPISYPLSKLMDHYFHPSAEVSAMKRGEVTAMVRIQYEEHLAWKLRHAKEVDKKKGVDIEKGDATFSAANSYARQCDDIGAFCGPCEPLTILRNTELYACITPYQHDGNCGGMGVSTVPSFSNPQQQDLADDDIIKLEGALSMKDKKVDCAYTPMNRVVSIMADTVLDENMVVQIYSYGYSRIPVMQQYLDDNNNPAHGICGIVLTKQLMLIGKEDRRRVSSLTMYEPPCVSPRSSLAEALNIVLSGKRKASNMALVCTDPDVATKAIRNMKPIPIEAGVLGIITLENILEELIQEPILDEKDKKMNLKLERAKWALGKWKAFVLRKRIQKDDDIEDNDVGLNANSPFDYIKMKEIV